jgi:site-specific DNA-methyltransferase (adenine-specific)
MCLTWWNKKDLIDFIKNIVSTYFDKNSNTYNISIQIKMELQSLIDRPKELLELCIESLTPKVIEKKKFGEVFTPLSFINDHMLKHLESYYKEKYNKNIFEDETLTWGDTTAGMGNFPIAIYYKLMDGLKVKIPNEKDRKKHIIENMLFMAEYNKKNCFIIKQIFNINNELKLNLYQGDSLQLDIQKEFGITKFDIVIGNPPYNEELKSTGAKALYNKFVEYYVNKCDCLTFIVPSRWFSGGKGLDKFREMMLNRKDIAYITHYDDACKIFGNSVDIKGGVNYFLIDKNYDGLCNYNGSNIQLNKYYIMVDSKYYNIIEQLSIYKNITDLYLGRYYGIESNDKRLKDDDKQIKCYVSQQKGFIKYIDKKEIKKEYNFYKVITTEAAYEGNSGFGNTFIGNLNEVHTGSYISFKVSTEKEATSLISYMKCKLPNFMLSLRKISQHINEIVCKWIPLPPLNKEWTDDEVYKYFKLSDKDIKLIQETNIVGYKDIIKSKTQIEESINNDSIEVKIESTKPKRKLKKIT